MDVEFVAHLENKLHNQEYIRKQAQAILEANKHNKSVLAMTPVFVEGTDIFGSVLKP